METVTNLVQALEQATLMAKQLPHHKTTDPTQTIQIYSALHAAHFHLSSFLSRTALPPPQPSLSSSSAAAADDGSPMAVGDNEEEEEKEMDEIEENSRRGDNNTAVEGVEEGMRAFFIRNTRPKKRSLSPSAVVAGEKRRVCEFGGKGDDDDRVGFDPNVNRLKSLELINQFYC